MKQKIIKNIVLFLVGFCVYITIEVCYRGVSYPLMGICGGIALIVIDKTNNRISWDTDILLQCLVGCLVITGLEFMIGELSLHNIVPRMWDYSNMPFNYKGIICLPFSCMWFALSFPAILLADAINYYIFRELPVPYYKIFRHKFLEFRKI